MAEADFRKEAFFQTQIVTIAVDMMEAIDIQTGLEPNSNLEMVVKHKQVVEFVWLKEAYQSSSYGNRSRSCQDLNHLGGQNISC